MERKIRGYKIASGRSPQELTNEVKQHLEHGFEPLGGVCVHTEKNGQGEQQTFFYQAVVEYE